MNKLLIYEPPLQILPTLARIIGLNESIFIQQLHYWVNNPKTNGTLSGGYKWVYNSYTQWQEDNFPFWSVATIQRVVSNLEKKNLIVTIQKRSTERKKYYRINYPELERVIEQWTIANCDDGQCQSDTVLYTESTSENTKDMEPNNSDELFGEPEDISQPQDETGKTVEYQPDKLLDTGIAKRNGGSGKKKTTIPGFQDMFNILAETCHLDIKLNRGKIAGVSKKLIAAGYTAGDITGFTIWWKNNDWRGKDGQPPTLELIYSLIKQAKETSGGEKSKPVEPKYDYEPYKNENGEIKLKRILIS